jgi:hypothetical protein
MPPRLLTLAIVLFWLCMTGLLFYHEILPRLRTGEAPPFLLDLGAEVGSNQIEWTVLFNDKRVGSGQSTVKRLPDRTFELKSSFRFDGFKLSKIVKVVEIDLVRFAGNYTVTEDGALLAMSSSMSAFIYSLDMKLKMDSVELQFDATIDAGQVTPNVLIKSTTFGEFQPAVGKAAFVQRGSVLNPMHPAVNRIPGLSPGRSWRIHLFDPVDMLQGVIGKLVPGFGEGSSIPILDATVKTDTITWGSEETPCFLIEYAEPGEPVKARTWVRRRDDAVLQQEARHAGMSILLQRVFVKNP